MPAGRPLEPAGDGRPRWMAATSRTGGTGPGVQVDSSVAKLLTTGNVALSRSWYRPPCARESPYYSHQWLAVVAALPCVVAGGRGVTSVLDEESGSERRAATGPGPGRCVGVPRAVRYRRDAARLRAAHRPVHGYGRPQAVGRRPGMG